jgi:hypothetical protein
MAVFKILYILLNGLLLFSCNGTAQVKVKDIKLTEVKNDNIKDPPPPTGLKVAAYLIYKDSTTSTFDVLNDKTIVLWNTVIGAGDAGKPSERTKIILTGKLDGLKVKINNGKRKVENYKLPNFSGEYELAISNTGCEEVKLIVTKLNEVIYQGKVPFKCGE